MDYVLAQSCPHESHDKDDDCRGIAYLHNEDKSLLVFTSKRKALDFVKDNRWSLNHIMIIPAQEALLEDE